MVARSQEWALLGIPAVLAARSPAFAADSQGCSRDIAPAAVMVVGARRSPAFVVVGDTCLSNFL